MMRGPHHYWPLLLWLAGLQGQQEQLQDTAASQDPRDAFLQTINEDPAAARDEFLQAVDDTIQPALDAVPDIR